MMILKNKEQLDEVMTAILDKIDNLGDILDKVSVYNNKKKTKIINNQVKSLKDAFNILKKSHKNEIKIWYK